MAALATDTAVKFGYLIDNTILKKPFCGVLIEQMQHNMLWNVLQCTVINMLLDMYAIDKSLDPFRFLYLQIGFAFLGLLTSRGKLYHYSDVIMGAMVSNYQPHHCWLNRLFKRKSNKTPMLRVTGLWADNSPVAGEFSHKWPVTRKISSFKDVIMLHGYTISRTPDNIGS